MKKLMTTLLASILAVSMIAAGCSKQETKPTDTKPADSPATKNPADIKGEITVWTWESAKTALLVNEEGFKKAYPNITVKYETAPNEDLYKKFILAAQAGSGMPDVMSIESRNMPQMIKTQALMDLTTKVGDDSKKMNDYKVKLATGPDNKLYAVPWDSAPAGVYYNRKVFKAAGLADDPESVAKLLNTWDNYYKVMKEIKDKTGVLAMATTKVNFDPSLFTMLLNQKAGKEDVFVFDKAGNVKLDAPQSIRIAEYIVKLFDDGFVYDAMRYTQPYYEAIKDGKVATVINAAWFTPMLKNGYGADRLGDWGVVPMPVWDEGDPATAESGGSNLAIPKTTQNLDAAWAYVNYNLMTNDGQVSQYKYGFFPSWEPAYGNAEVTKPDPFFVDQNERKLFEGLAPKVVAVNYTEDFPRARLLIASSMQSAITDKSKTVEQWFKEAADELRSKTGRK